VELVFLDIDGVLNSDAWLARSPPPFTVTSARLAGRTDPRGRMRYRLGKRLETLLSKKRR
jgi:hypothetical protein